MEDFLVALLFLIFYLVAASSGKKKRKKKRSPMRNRAEGERRDVRAQRRDRQTMDGFGEAFAQFSQKKPESQKPDSQTLCDARQMHLHEVGQNSFSVASEGEDPCHVGGYERLEAERGDALQPEEVNSPAQEVLRGVIMSEILTRPCERRAMQRKGFR